MQVFGQKNAKKVQIITTDYNLGSKTGQKSKKYKGQI